MEHNNAPCVQLSEYGMIADKHINKINTLQKGLLVDKYIIMPNHIHMIIIVERGVNDSTEALNDGAMWGVDDGAMWTSRPTSSTNAAIPSIIRSFKTMVTKEIGFSLWQATYHDRIIRNEDEYQRIWQYIDENPLHWAEDDYFV